MPGDKDQRHRSGRLMGLRILVFQHHPASPASFVGERMATRTARITTLAGPRWVVRGEC
jgi:hypothetical protein